MATVGAVHSADSWDQPSTSNRPNTILRRPVPTTSVPDDWDADDDEEEENNQKIWEDANTRAPMPELIISSSTTTATVVPPPATAFQAPMRILKRPSSQNASPNSTSSQTPAETLAQREARYHAARERIFKGDDGSGSNVSDTGSVKSKHVGGARNESPSIPAVNVVRNPIGPSDNSKDTEGGRISKGFKRGSTKGPRSSQRPPAINGS